MSRKKAVKSKAATSSPSAGSSVGKGTGKAARSSPGIVQMNGVVHPSRPSISNSSEFYDIAFKVMLVGDSGVGKTCLLVRFKDGAFLAGSFISTVGIDFRVSPPSTLKQHCSFDPGRQNFNDAHEAESSNFWSRWKDLDSYWMDYAECLNRHPWPPEDKAS